MKSTITYESQSILKIADLAATYNVLSAHQFI